MTYATNQAFFSTWTDASDIDRRNHMKGYQTGDIVKAVVTHRKRVGTYVGRVADRRY
jgi:hypothetical protein